MSSDGFLVRLPADLKQTLEDEAAADDRTQAQVVRRALRMYFAMPDEQRRLWKERT